MINTEKSLCISILNQERRYIPEVSVAGTIFYIKPRIPDASNLFSRSYKYTIPYLTINMLKKMNVSEVRKLGSSIRIQMSDYKLNKDQTNKLRDMIITMNHIHIQEIDAVQRVITIATKIVKKSNTLTGISENICRDTWIEDLTQSIVEFNKIE
jgi:hypothetical protein